MSRPTLEVADIVRASGNRFWEHYGSHLAWPHRKVLDAIIRCRVKRHLVCKRWTIEKADENSNDTPLIQVFIFSSRCCFNDCFFFSELLASSILAGASVVICNTAVILLSDLVFPKTSISLSEFLTASLFHPALHTLYRTTDDADAQLR